MKVAILALLALAAFAQVAQAQSEALDSLTLFDNGFNAKTAPVGAQRSLLQTRSLAATYSPSPSPKPCKFANTKNVNYYSVTIRSTANWGAGRDGIVAAAAAVYKRYSQRLRVKVTGTQGQTPQYPYYDFTYLVEVPVTRCVGFKEGMRAALRTAIKRVRSKGQIKAWFGIIE